MMQTSTRRLLRHFINSSFSLEEIKNLCFDLAVDYDNLPGEGKEGKIRELISYLERRQNIDRLLSELRRLRQQNEELQMLAERLTDEHQLVQSPIAIGGMRHSVTSSAVVAQRPEDLIERPPILIGRDQTLENIHGLLDQNRRVLLQGFSGMGKTAIAATVAGERIARNEGPVIWLRAGHDNADSLFDAIGYALGEQSEIARTAGDARLRAVRELLSRAGALLVLDDVWNGPALKMVTKAVPSGLPLLVTSRNRYPELKRIDVGKLSEKKAVELLGFYADEDLSRDLKARELCKILGYHAFALEIASKTMQVDEYTPRELLRRIEQSPHDLKMPEDFAEEGRGSVKLLLDASVEPLDEVTRATFFAMGAMFVPYTTPDLLAEFLRQATPRFLANQESNTSPFPNAEQVSDSLTLLQRRGLADREAETEYSITRYRIHDLAYSYARAQVIDDDRHRTLDAIRVYVDRYSECNANDFSHLLPELDNFISGAAWAMKVERYDEVDYLASNLFFEKILDLYGFYSLGITLLNYAVGAAVAQNQRERQARRLGDLGKAYARANQQDRATECFHQALRISREEHDREGEGIHLGNLGAVYILLKEHKKAIDFLERALKIRREVFDQPGEAKDLGNLGVAYRALGDHHKAIEFYEKALAISRRVDDRLGMEADISNLGNVYSDLGNYDKAIDYYHRALDICRDTIYRPGEAHNLSLLGAAYLNKQCHQKALEFHMQALEIRREIGDSPGEIEALSALGDANANGGRHQQAIGHYQKALEIAKDINDHAHQQALLSNLGLAYANLERFTQAIAYGKEAIDGARAREDQENEALYLSNLGWTYRNSSEYDEAISCYEQAVALAREQRNELNEGIWLNTLGEVFASAGRFDQALTHSRHALEIARKLESKPNEALCLGNLGFAYSNHGDYERAIELYQEALTVTHEADDRTNEGIWLANIGLCYLNLGLSDKAIESYQLALAVAQEQNDLANQGSWLANLSLAYDKKGEFEQAIVSTKRALIFARQLEDRNNEILWLVNLGNFHQKLSQYDKAVDHYQQARAINSDLGSRQLEGVVLGNLGSAYYDQGMLPLALSHVEQALSIASETKDRSYEGSWLGYCAGICSDSGQIEQAAIKYKQALAIARELEERPNQAFLLANLCIVHSNLEADTEATSCLQSAWDLAPQIGDRRLDGYLHVIEGNLHHAQAEYADAANSAAQAVTVAKSVQDPLLRGYAQASLCKARLCMGELEDALNSITAALEHNAPKQTHSWYGLKGIILARLDYLEAATSAFREALLIADDLLAKAPVYYGAKYSRGVALSGLAILSAAKERPTLVQQAKSAYSVARENYDAKSVLVEALRDLDQLRPLDTSGVLTSIRQGLSDA